MKLSVALKNLPSGDYIKLFYIKNLFLWYNVFIKMKYYKRKVLSGEIMLKRGNIVRFKCGYWGEPDSYATGRLGVIEYSYGERYGNGNVYGGYCVLDKETGSSSSWWDEDYLEFVSKGGEDEIKKCKKIAQTIKERNEDLDYIKKEMLNRNLKTKIWITSKKKC